MDPYGVVWIHMVFFTGRSEDLQENMRKPFSSKLGFPAKVLLNQNNSGCLL